LVVLSTDAAVGLDGDRAPLARECGHVLELTDELAATGVDWDAALNSEPRLYVELSTSRYPAERLGELGAAVKSRGNALFVADEAHATVPVAADARLLQLWSEGRKRAVDCIAVTASAMQRSGSSLNPLVKDLSNVRVAFNVADAAVQAKIARDCPPLAEHLSSLATPRDGGAPEFGVYTSMGRAELVRRSGVVNLA